MTLLEKITKAAEQQPLLPPQSNHPIILSSDGILHSLKPLNDDELAGDSEEEQVTLIKRVHGWNVSESDSDAIESGNQFCKKLKRRLKNPNKDDFLKLFDSFLEKNRERLNLSDKSHTRLAMVKKLGFLLTPNVAALVLEGCLVLEIWDLVETLIVQGVVGRFSSCNLIQSLVEKKKSDLICLCIMHFGDIGSSDALAVLNYFLSPPKGARGTMKNVRKKWEKQALLAIEKAASDENVNLAKQASVLLMIAYDGFSAAELCMHFLFASPKLGELTLSYCLSGLDGLDMLKLVRYFGKWVNKYLNFPQAGSCPKAATELGLELCDWVPSLESVVKHLGLVLDEHFSSLVLYNEFHDELKLLEEGVMSLASEARFCCSLANVVENLKLDVELH